MSTFPSVLTSYTNPNPTDRLNAPSHSGIESAQNSGLSQLEDVIGIEGSASVVGTFQYLVRSPASDGGGHVQGVNKGGTGQTTYNKGDILVGQSSSILTKFAVGTDGYVLTADSTQSNGMGWMQNSPLLDVNVIPTSVIASGVETTVYTKALSAGFFNANAGIHLKANYSVLWTTNNAPVVTVNIKYNTSIVGTVALSNTAPGGDDTVRTYKGVWESTILNTSSVATQTSITRVMGILQTDSNVNVANLRYSDVRNSVMSATVNTSGAVTLTVTYTSGQNAAGTGWKHDNIIVEKLIKFV